jgi:hypothetical protein
MGERRLLADLQSSEKTIQLLNIIQAAFRLPILRPHRQNAIEGVFSEP